MKTNDRDIPGEAVAGGGWNNRLPAWIRSDPAYKDLRQGPRHTLQVIADRCNAPPRDDNAEIIGSAALLPCFGGRRLRYACGCGSRTVWRHLGKLIGLGYVVPLSYGVGGLANVYGVPDSRGELDRFRARPGERCGSGPGGRWEHADTKKLLALLCQNDTLADGDPTRTDPCQNDTETRVKMTRRPVPKRHRDPCQIDALPSPLPSSCTSAHIPSSSRRKKARALQDDDAGRPSSTRNTIDGLLPKVERLPIKAETKRWPPGTNPVFRKLALKLPDGAGADEVQVVLRSNGVDPGRAYKLAWNPHVTPAMIRDVLGRVIPNLPTIENPGGYIGNLIDDAIAKARDAQREREARDFEADQQRLAEAEAAIYTMPDDELQELIKSIGVLRDLSPAAVRADRAFRVEVARRMSSKREVDAESVAGVPT